MPKGRKSKTDRKRHELAGSDDETISENGSITSSISEIKSVYEDGETETEDNSEQELFEEKLKEAIDGATQKSAKGRQDCLEALCKAMASRYIVEFLSDRRDTITDCIERSLKKGKGSEQGAASNLAISLCIQLGPGEDSEAVFKNLHHILLTVASDNSASSSARAKCFTALGLLSFITEDVVEPLNIIMSSLEQTFSGSYFKGNGVAPNLNTDMTSLHNSALSSWALLLTIMTPSQLYSMIKSHLYRLPELLESSDVDLRITAGETVAIFYEIIRTYDEEFEGDDIAELCDKLKQLATDSHKYRAKKDRKQQRSSFRDIIKTIEARESPSYNVKFGRETLEIDTWCKKKQYDAFCQALGSGMNLHLKENYLLRDIFGLGAPLDICGENSQKISKFERHLMNSAAFKARTLTRGKFRDKRTAVFC